MNIIERIKNGETYVLLEMSQYDLMDYGIRVNEDEDHVGLCIEFDKQYNSLDLKGTALNGQTYDIASNEDLKFDNVIEKIIEENIGSFDYKWVVEGNKCKLVSL